MIRIVAGAFIAIDWSGPWTFASTEQIPVPCHRSLNLLVRTWHP